MPLNAQEIVEIAPFWEALDNLEPAGINDLYTDLNLPDTMKKYGPFPVTWESSDTLFLGHDGRINGRLVGENKEVTLTATLYDNERSTPRAEKRDFKVSIHGFEPYSNYLFAYFPANNNGEFGCVGCGRCLSKCPISMNIVKVMKALEVK